MTSYPKIDTLFNRDEKFKVIEGDFSCPEFKKIRDWEHVTEKIHGTNVRVMIGPLDTAVTLGSEPASDRDLLDPQVFYMGRTDKSQLPEHLAQHLRETYNKDALLHALRKAKGADGVILYMEGYGPRIQDGGNYRKGACTRIFDIFVLDMSHGPCAYTKEGAEQSPGGWWLAPDAVSTIASELGVNTVPSLGKMSTEEIVELVKSKIPSCVSNMEGGNAKYQMEGVVARTTPLLLRRNGTRLMFKLKVRDFA